MKYSIRCIAPLLAVLVLSAGCNKSAVNMEKMVQENKLAGTARIMSPPTVALSYSPPSGSFGISWDNDLGQFLGPYVITISGGGVGSQTFTESSTFFNTTLFFTPGSTVSVTVKAVDNTTASASIVIDGTPSPTPKMLPGIDCAVNAAYPYTHISYTFTWSTTPYLGMTDSIYFYIENRDYFPPQYYSGAGSAAFSAGTYTMSVARLARSYGSNRDLIYLGIDSRYMNARYPPFTPRYTYEYTIPGIDYFGHWWFN